MPQKLSRYAREKILIADDEEVIVELTSLLLKKRGFSVSTAADGQRCIDMVAEHRPALVLLDYMMPVMNGLEVLKRIRRQSPETYVVMFTGRGSEEVAVEAMKAGAIDYLQKPFVNQSLLERIDTVLARREIELENRKLIAEREFLQNEIRQWNVELEKRVQQKSRELEQAHKEILQSEKLAALGHMSAGMVHEIRNPLNSINLFAQILLSAEDLGAELKGYVTRIAEEVTRIDHILVEMLASSHRPEKNSRSVDVAETVRQVLDSVQAQLSQQRIELVLDLDPKVRTLQADPLEVEQIFSNLITNALYEMPDGGSLSLTLREDGDKLSITIADSGAGIPKENLDKIFDPFFTTKKQGTGFGLSVVLRIVSHYGGSIQAENRVGGGARFLVELPLLSPAPD